MFDCNACHTRCDGVSKGVYQFDNDASFSEAYEQMIIDHINAAGRYKATKCEELSYPDIEICDAYNNIYSYLEVKVQQRTFMQVEKSLSLSNLTPSETVALNLSDLLRYFKIQRDTNTQVVIVWVLLNRLCIVEDGRHQLYFQTATELETIYNSYKTKRRFMRRSGDGDVVNGVHKGVTVNYHFSLKELKPWKW